MQYFQGQFEERCHSTGGPNNLSFFTAIWSLIFLLTNIPGNLLVILAVALDPYKNLRTPFNYLMASLACADLLVGTVTEPLSVYIHIKEGLDLNLSLRELETLHMSYFIGCTASVLSLGTLAVERYLAIRNPHTYRNKLTGKRILLTIVCIWGISIMLPSLYFEVGFITYAFIFANTALVAVFAITCFIYGLMLKKFYERRMQYTERTQSLPRNRQIALTQPRYQTMVQNSPVPRPYTKDQSETEATPDTPSETREEIQQRGSIVPANAGRSMSNSLQASNQSRIKDSPQPRPHSRNHESEKAIQETRVSQDVTRNSQNPPQESQITNESSPASNAIYNSCQALEEKITKMFFIVLIAMLCCYGPSTVFIYVMSFCETCKCESLHWFRDLQFLFVIMNSSINFYCYAIRSPRFRNAFKYILRLKRPEDVQPATLKAVKPATLES